MATRNALSCSYIDVNNAVNGGGGTFVGPANDGDTVIVPAGSQIWTTQLIINRGINLIGQTKINSDGTANDQTTIHTALTAGASVISHTTVLGKTYRTSGLTFIKDSGSNNAVIGFSGNSDRVRVDNCHFAPMTGQAVGFLITGGVYGVADHNLFEPEHTQVFHMLNGDTSGNVSSLGCPTRAVDPGWGTSTFFFIEDNWFLVPTGYNGQNAGLIDTDHGCKVVIRHNNIRNTWIATHGTEGSTRGNWALEIYGNVWNNTKAVTVGGFREGNGFLYNNTWNGTAPNPANMSMNTQRSQVVRGLTFGGNGDSTFGGAGGNNPWDVNETEGLAFSNPPGVYVEGHAPHQYYPPTAGTWATCVNSPTASTTIKVAGASWTSNQWAGFTANRNDGAIGFILSNTPDTLTVGTTAVYTLGAKVDWANGDQLRIYKLLTALDQCGRGKGDLCLRAAANYANGDPKIYNSLPPGNTEPLWPHQVMEPLYSWNNVITAGGAHVGFHPSIAPTVLENRDYYNDKGGIQTTSTNPFDGTTGVGYGHGLTKRPATGQHGVDIAHVSTNGATGNDVDVPGVGYWDMDAAPLVSGDSGKFYRWKSGGWVAYYQPYQYPHPLTTGGVAVPTIISSPSTSFTEGVGGTFQAASTGFSASPTWTHSGGTFPASGTTLSSGGLLTVGAGSAAGVYNFTLTATNGSEVDTQSFTLTITAAPTRVIALSGSLAFGNVDINTSAQKNFTITNNGNVVLTVTDITLPSGFVANQTSFTVAPAASHLVNVTFSPTTPGAYSGTATVVSDKTSGTNTMAVSGLGANRVMVLSGSLAFGNVTTGQTATRQLTITNNGNVLMNVAAITYPQGFSGDFTSGTIAAGGSKIINVTFSPLAAQVYSGNVDIQSDKTSGTSTIAISGTGVATATKIIQLTGDLNFGSIQTGTTVNRTLTITNGGDTTLNVSGITYPTGFTGAFAGTVAPGASHDVTVTFAPVAATSYSGTVTVASDATGGINTTTASGTGVAPATMIVGLSGSLDFGNVQTGANSIRVLTIANTGSAPLAVSGITYPSGFTGAYTGTIAPGATQDVTVTFAPTLVQSYGGTVTVASNATSGTNTTSASGAGVAAQTKIIGVTGNLVFGNVQKSHSIQKIMTILNTGTDTLSVTNITCPTGFTVNLTTATIAPGASQNVTVTFKPIAQQSYGGNITVASDKTSGVNTIACSGNGTNKRQVPFILIVG